MMNEETQQCNSLWWFWTEQNLICKKHIYGARGASNIASSCPNRILGCIPMSKCTLGRTKGELRLFRRSDFDKNNDCLLFLLFCHGISVKCSSAASPDDVPSVTNSELLSNVAAHLSQPTNSFIQAKTQK